MRQVGILCAGALVALHENVAKLEGDHKKAKNLAGTFSIYLVQYTKLLFELKERHHIFTQAVKLFSFDVSHLPIFRSFRGTKSNQRTTSGY